MIGAIIGDIVGSVFEFHNIKSVEFPLFSGISTYTDDTVLTVAVADAFLLQKPFGEVLHQWGKRFPDRGYGFHFQQWLKAEHPVPYGSFGNGSAMRVSPVAYVAQSLEETLELASKTACVSHNHKEGIKGAQAIACAVYLARTGSTKEEIKSYIEERFDYDLNFTIEDIRPDYEFDVTCQGSVPEAIVAFLESHDFENAIRLAVSLGGDSDTIGCMTGAIAEAFYSSVPQMMIQCARKRLPPEMLQVIDLFDETYLAVNGQATV